MANPEPGENGVQGMSVAMGKARQDQSRASHPHSSVWVGANAGTGKTHVLTQRVIRLLLDGTPPERILCLTFTKAAASEMARRLFKDLGAWATMADGPLQRAIQERVDETLETQDLPKARRLFAQALETPGGLKIQTIHAFCERLLGRFPLEAQVPPDFQVLDDRTAQDLMAHALENMLQGISEDDDGPLSHAHDLLVTRFDEYGFQEIFDHVRSKRTALNQFFQHHGGLDPALDALRAALKLSPGETAETIVHEVMAEEFVDPIELRQFVEMLQAGSKSDKAQAALLSGVLETDDATEAFELYAQVFLKKTDGQPKSRLVTKTVAEANPGLLDFLTSEQSRIAHAQERRKAALVYDSSAALFRLAEKMLGYYADEKHRRGALDYDDLILRAAELLQTSSSAAWVLYKLDGGLDHILVDEAQDTSPPQWAVIKSLANEFFSGAGSRQDRTPDLVRTVFAVGDEKQSIYSFQGADPDMFQRMQLEFEQRVSAAEQAWSAVDFHLSFRSTEPVLQIVDAIFEDDDLAVRLTASGKAIEHVARREGHAGLVELWPLITDDEIEDSDPWDAPLDQEKASSAEAILAERIAQTVKNWVDQGEILESQGRPIEAGDILILVRRRDAFMDHMIRELKSRSIPVAGADRVDLLDQLPVLDILAVADFTLLPSDDLTLASILKSPFLGLSEQDLFELCYRREGTVWDELIRRSQSNTKLLAAYRFLKYFLDLADVIAPFEFFHHLIDGQPIDGQDRRTGRLRITERLGREANDMLDEVLNLALAYERTDLPSLQGFLDWFRYGDAELKREPDQGPGQVRVMTVHGAKGLDGNIVFLPDTCQAPSAALDDRILPLKDDVLVWRPGRRSDHDPVTAAARDIASDNRDAEYYRLLYVAATRARDRLYIAGYHGVRAPGPASWYHLIASALKPLAQEVVDASGQMVWRLESKQVAAAEPLSPIASIGPEKTSLPAWIDQPAPSEDPKSRPLSPSRIPVPADTQDFEPPMLSPLADNGALRFLRGRLIHSLLQYLPDCPKEQYQELASRYIARRAGELTSDEQGQIVSESLAILSDATFAEIFGPNSQAEVALTGHLSVMGEERFVAGQIDRLCVAEDRVLVIDFKTNRPPPESETALAQVYRRQMAVYRALLAKIYPDREIRCALLWTDGPRLMPLSDGLLDDALADLHVP